jgi:hypothetical protein
VGTEEARRGDGRAKSSLTSSGASCPGQSVETVYTHLTSYPPLIQHITSPPSRFSHSYPFLPHPSSFIFSLSSQPPNKLWGPLFIILFSQHYLHSHPPHPTGGRRSRGPPPSAARASGPPSRRRAIRLRAVTWALELLPGGRSCELRRCRRRPRPASPSRRRTTRATSPSRGSGGPLPSRGAEAVAGSCSPGPGGRGRAGREARWSAQRGHDARAPATAGGGHGAGACHRGPAGVPPSVSRRACLLRQPPAEVRADVDLGAMASSSLASPPALGLELPLLSLPRPAAAAHLLFPFLLLARSKNGLLWVPRIVLSRESVSPGGTKEMRGRRDFPILLEETAAGCGWSEQLRRWSRCRCGQKGQGHRASDAMQVGQQQHTSLCPQANGS